jgi:hypothetical protein
MINWYICKYDVIVFLQAVTNNSFIKIMSRQDVLEAANFAVDKLRTKNTQET